MLNQNPDESFVRSEDRAVEHHRTMLLPVLTHEGRIQAFGEHTIGLKRANLPGTPDCVLEMPLKLWRIESALARQLFPAKLFRRHAGGGDCLAKFVFSLVPVLVAAEPLVGAKRELHRISRETEVL